MPEIKVSQGGQRRALQFFLLLALSFLLILIFNSFTPMLSDDYTYGAQVHDANGLKDLIDQEYAQYMTWNGRSVVHLLLRITLALPAWLFKITNSLLFVMLTLLVYANVQKRKAYDIRLLLLITLLVWLFGVDFAQTILWQTGACNYLWGMVLILGVLTLERKEFAVAKEAGLFRGHYLVKEKQVVSKAVLLFAYGVIAGWCNENTSGALVLVLLAMNLYLWIRFRRFSVPLFTGAGGAALGLMCMVCAPGNANRAQYSEENYSGLAGYLARFEKIIVVIDEYFFLLLCIYAVLLVVNLLVTRERGKGGRQGAVRAPLFWLGLALITSFALILAPSAMPRAHFGAGIFLIIGICQLSVNVVYAAGETSASFPVKAVVYSFLIVLCVRFFFVYIEDGTNLFRIYRDCSERTHYIEEQKAAGADQITVAQVHSAFYNSYSAIDTMDLQEDPAYWINVGMEQYYKVDVIRAVPYDVWAAEYKAQEQ